MIRLDEQFYLLTRRHCSLFVDVLSVVNVLFVDVLYINMPFLTMSSVDALSFIDTSFVNSLPVDALSFINASFTNVLSIDVPFVDASFVDVLFVDLLSIDALPFINTLFADVLSIDMSFITTSSIDVLSFVMHCSLMHCRFVCHTTTFSLFFFWVVAPLESS